MPDVTRPPDSLFAASAATAIFWTSGGNARKASTIVFVACAVIFMPPAIESNGMSPSLVKKLLPPGPPALSRASVTRLMPFSMRGSTLSTSFSKTGMPLEATTVTSRKSDGASRWPASSRMFAIRSRRTSSWPGRVLPIAAAVPPTFFVRASWVVPKASVLSFALSTTMPYLPSAPALPLRALPTAFVAASRLIPCALDRSRMSGVSLSTWSPVAPKRSSIASEPLIASSSTPVRLSSAPACSLIAAAWALLTLPDFSIWRSRSSCCFAASAPSSAQRLIANTPAVMPVTAMAAAAPTPSRPAFITPPPILPRRWLWVDALSADVPSLSSEPFALPAGPEKWSLRVRSTASLACSARAIYAPAARRRWTDFSNCSSSCAFAPRRALPTPSSVSSWRPAMNSGQLIRSGPATADHPKRAATRIFRRERVDFLARDIETTFGEEGEVFSDAWSKGRSTASVYRSSARVGDGVGEVVVRQELLDVERERAVLVDEVPADRAEADEGDHPAPLEGLAEQPPPGCRVVLRRPVGVGERDLALGRREVDLGRRPALESDLGQDVDEIALGVGGARARAVAHPDRDVVAHRVARLLTATARIA
jgi:hypothetical protein